MRRTLSFFVLIFFSSCYFNSVGHREIIKAQNAIDSQNFKDAEKRLVNALRLGLGKELRIKALHQLGVVRAFHLNDLYGALEVFKETYFSAVDIESKKKSATYLADLYFSMLRDYKNSMPLYEDLFNKETDLKLKKEYFERFVKSLFEMQNFSLVVKKLEQTKININNYSLLIIKSLSLYFLGDDKSAEFLLSSLENLQGINSEQLAETKFYKALIFEDSQELKKSYTEYLDIFQLFPNSNLIKLRVDRLLHRKKSSKR